MKLGDYYRTHGDSLHVLNVEASLTDAWQTTAEIATRSHRSYNFCTAALKYLHEEDRSEQRQADLERPIRGQTWQWEWRLPQ